MKSCVISTPGFSRFPNISPRPNRPLPSSPGPRYQNKRSAFDMEMFFHSHASKIHFHNKGCALGLILKVRVLELGSGLQTPLYLKNEKKHASLTTHYRYLCITLEEMTIIIKKKIYLVGFLKTLPPDGLFRSNSLFSAKNYLQSSHYKNQECDHFFFSLLLLSSSSLFLFLLSFSFVRVILELIAHKKPAFWRLFTQNDGKFR